MRRLARYWCVSPRRVRELVRKQILRPVAFGKTLRFTPAAVRDAEAVLTPTASRPRRPRRGPDISLLVRALLNMDGDT